MGKGDKRTRRGKIYNGSHGNKRPPGAPTHAADKTVAKQPTRRTATHKK